MPLICQMHAYLIFLAGQKIYLQQAESLVLFKHLIRGVCEFAFCGIGRGIDYIRLILGQV